MIEAILNGIPTDTYVGYLFYMMIGVFISIGTQQFKFFKPIKQYGGFKFTVWIKENWKRVAFVLVAMHLAIVFQEQLGQSDPSNWSAMTLGLTLDVVLDRILNRKK